MHCRGAEAFLNQREELHTQLFIFLLVETRWTYDQIMQKVNTKSNGETASISMKKDSLLSA
jgi:hypothetical protein